MPHLRARCGEFLLVVIASIGVALASASCGKPAPSIEITSPQDGVFTTNTLITVQGILRHIQAADAQVLVNGIAAAIDPLASPLTWSVNVPIDPGEIFNPVVAQLTQTSTGLRKRQLVNVLYGSSVADGSFSPQSLALRMTDAGLDQIEPLVRSFVDFDISQFFSPGAEVINQSGIVGTLDRASISGFSIDADARAGRLHGTTTVTGLFVSVDLVSLGFIPCTLDLSASSLSLPGDYQLESASGALVDVNLVGDILANFQGFDSDFSSGICSLPGIENLVNSIAGDLEAQFVAGLVQQLRDPDAAGPMDSAIAEGVEQGLAAIDVTGPIGDLIGVTIEAPGALADEDEDGLTFGADARILADAGSQPGQCDAPPGAPDLMASLEIPTAFPIFGATTPVSGEPYGIAIALSPSSLNQLFKAATECGLLELELTELTIGQITLPLTAGLLASFDPGFGIFDPSMPLEARISATLAPVVTEHEGPGGELLDLRIGGLRFDIVDATYGTVYLGASLRLRLGIDVGLEDGKLRPLIGDHDPGSIRLTIVENRVNANEALLEQVLPLLLAPLLPSFTNTIGSFPLPEFLDLELDAVEISRQGGFLAIYADLITPSCNTGYEYAAGLCFPFCNGGYSGVAETCWENCPAGYFNGDTFCRHDSQIDAKGSYGRGVGAPAGCAASEQFDAGLCYPWCSAGYSGVGPVCWRNCDPGFIDDGAFCRVDAIIDAKNSYGRGAGTVPTSCGGQENDAGLCYPWCASGYDGVGPVCWQICPSGYTDDGAFCRKDAHIFGKDSSGCPWYNLCCASCPPGYTDDGCFCRRDAHIFAKSSYGRGAGTTPSQCGGGQQLDAGLCYPFCAAGYTGVGPVCWQNCPAGFIDDGAFCRKDAVILAKHSYGRGVGAPVHACGGGAQFDAGLCYPFCAAGYSGVGPVCWQNCPAGFIDDGAFCRKEAISFQKDSYTRAGEAPPEE